MTRKSGISATLPEKFAMRELFVEHILLIEGDGDSPKTDLYSFEANWNDARIAQEINPALNAAHASRVRDEMFGKLFGRRSGVTRRTNSNDLADRLTALEQRVGRMSECMKLTSDEYAYIFHANSNEETTNGQIK